MKKTALPTPVAVSRAMNTLIEGEYWPATLSTAGAYIRRHDDTNGETGPDQELAVTFSPDGDAWVMLPGFTSLRFRTWAGGGCSLRVRKGLMVLAEAIRRDNAERPQHDLSETVDPRMSSIVQAEEAKLYRELTGDALALGYQGLVDALADLGKLRTGPAAPVALAAPENLIPPGWLFHTADFSMQAAGKLAHGSVMLTRDAAGRAEFYALPDDSEAQKAYGLFATGKGATLREAIAAAVATIGSAA